jgi:hypothetical protein
MAYGTIKVDTITFTDAGVDKSVTISGLVQNPTFSGNITVTGTVSGNTIRGQTVSGATITGGAAAFTTVTGGVATITSGVFALGSASNPSISFSGDANSGLYSPGADQVAISTNGTGRLFINATGQVGIGGSPSSDFEITSALPIARLRDTTDNSYAEILNNNGALSIRADEGNVASASYIDIRVDGSERARFTSDGRLGLGTISPDFLFQAAGGIASVTPFGQLTALQAAGGTGFRWTLNNNGTFALQRTTNGFTSATTPIFVDSSDRVGIGTTSPDSDLHLLKSSGGDVNVVLKVENSTTGQAQLHISAGSGTSNRAARVNLYNRVSSTTTPRWSIINDIDQNGTNGLSIVNAAGNTALNISQARTATFTADASNAPFIANIGASEVARIDSSGRLLVGTTSTSNIRFQQNASFVVTGDSTYGGATFAGYSGTGLGDAAPNLDICRSRGTTDGSFTKVENGDRLGALVFRGADGSTWRDAASISSSVDGGTGASDMPGRLVFSTTADGASSPTERMRIGANGSFRIGQTTTDTPGLSNTTVGIGIEPANGAIFLSRGDGSSLFVNRNSDGASTGFYRSGTLVGTISITTTATAYNTSSDYRLKENVVQLTGAADRLNQLQVKRFNFIADPDKTVDGFIAHEAQAVVPECVTGTKDEVDDDGNPVYQGIDQSKLVPLLTAALQEAIAEIASLKDRVAALEAS